MNIPNLPHILTPLVTMSGHMHPDWYSYFTQLNNELQINQSEEGSVIPQQSTTNIGIIQGKINNVRLIYDNILQIPKITVNGVFKTITTS